MELFLNDRSFKTPFMTGFDKVLLAREKGTMFMLS